MPYTHDEEKVEEQKRRRRKLEVGELFGILLLAILVIGIAVSIFVR